MVIHDENAFVYNILNTLNKFKYYQMCTKVLMLIKIIISDYITKLPQVSLYVCIQQYLIFIFKVPT